MSIPAWIAPFTTIARLVLETEDVERMALPAIADAVSDSEGKSPARGAASLGWQLASIVVLATWHRVTAAATTANWWPLFAATLAGVAGSVGLQHTELGSLSHSQLVFVLIGLIAAFVVVLAPPRLARTLGGLALLLSLAALIAVPWAGFAWHGAHRWLRVGPIAVHVSVLVLPAFVPLLARVADRWRGAFVAAFVTTTLALLLLQPDPTSAVVYAVTAAAACWRSSSRPWVLTASALGIVASLALRAPLPPVAHVEGAPRLLAAQGPLWLIAGAGAIVLVIVLTARGWKALASRATPASKVMERQAAGAVVGLAALMTVPQLLGDGGVPLISFGGSAVFATFVLTAIAVRSIQQGLSSLELKAA